jgi:hypothetical protein
MGHIIFSSGDTGELKSRTSMSTVKDERIVGMGFEQEIGGIYTYILVPTKTSQNFGGSVCSRARILRSLAVTVAQCALTTENLR